MWGVGSRVSSLGVGSWATVLGSGLGFKSEVAVHELELRNNSF